MLARPTTVLRFRASPVARQQQTGQTSGPRGAPHVPGLALRSAILNTVKDRFTTFPELPQPREDGTLSSQQIKFYSDFAKAWMGRKVFMPIGQQTLRDVDQVFMVLHLVDRQPYLAKEEKELFSSFKNKFLNTVREELPNYNIPDFPSYPLDETVSSIGSKYHPADVLNFVKQRVQEERKDPSKDVLDQFKRNLRAEWTNLIEPAYRRKLRNPHEYMIRMGYTIKDIEEIEKQTLPQPSFNRRFPQSPYKYPTDFLQKQTIEARQKNDYEKFGFPNLSKSAEELEQQYAIQNAKSFDQVMQESRQQIKDITPDQKNVADKLKSRVESILLSKLSESEKAEFNRLKSSENSLTSDADIEAWGKFQQKLINIGLTLVELPTRNQWTTYDVLYDSQLLVKGQWEHTKLARDPALTAFKDQFIQLAKQAEEEWKDFEATGGKVTLAMLLSPSQVEARETTVTGAKKSPSPPPPQQQQQQPPKGTQKK